MMAKFAANITGFQAIEYLFPYDYDPEVLSQPLIDNQLKQALFNMPPGDWVSEIMDSNFTLK
jgi:2-dehydrotetronate isomerase